MSQRIKVKAKYRDTVIGFNNSGKPLSQRDDLHLLLEMAKASNDTYILGMFEEVPTDEEIINEKEKAFIDKKHSKARKRKQNQPPNNQSE